jgi:translation initiation factor IF-2
MTSRALSKGNLTFVFSIAFKIQKKNVVLVYIINKRLRIPKWQSKLDNPDKLATQVHTTKQNKNTTHYMLGTTIRNHTQIT